MEKYKRLFPRLQGIDDYKLEEHFGFYLHNEINQAIHTMAANDPRVTRLITLDKLLFNGSRYYSLKELKQRGLNEALFYEMLCDCISE